MTRTFDETVLSAGSVLCVTLEETSTSEAEACKAALVTLAVFDETMTLAADASTAGADALVSAPEAKAVPLADCVALLAEETMDPDTTTEPVATCAVGSEMEITSASAGVLLNAGAM